MVDRRGKTHGAFRVVPARDRPEGRLHPLEPQRYFERMLQREARRFNFILGLADRHFEARKFLLDLAGVLKRDPAPLRRA